MSGSILNNVLQNGLKSHFSPELISQLASSAFVLPDLGLSDEEKSIVLDVYMQGLHTVFVSYGILTAVMFLASLCLFDYGLGNKETGESVEAEDPLLSRQDA